MKPLAKKSQTRGALSQADSVLVAVWIPKQLKEELDAEVRRQDSDRSKIIRGALRLKLKAS